MKSQTQKPSKDNTTSQAFNDVVRSLLAVLDKLIRDFSALVIVFIFVLLTSVYLLLRAINLDYTYPLSVTFLFMLLSLGLYFKDKSFLSAIIAFSLGIFTAFTVTWNGSTFTIFVISFSLLFVLLFLIVCIRLAANVEEKLTRAANFYRSDFATNKKDLKEVANTITQQKRDKGGLLSTTMVYDAILFFAYQKVLKSRMIILINGLNRIYTLTKVDTESLLLLLNNINLISHEEEDLATNITSIQLYLMKGQSTSSNLVKILNDALHIAIENNIDFVLFTDAILAYLSYGYTQPRIIEKLSTQFTKEAM